MLIIYDKFDELISKLSAELMAGIIKELTPSISFDEDGKGIYEGYLLELIYKLQFPTAGEWKKGISPCK